MSAIEFLEQATQSGEHYLDLARGLLMSEIGMESGRRILGMLGSMGLVVVQRERWERIVLAASGIAPAIEQKAAQAQAESGQLALPWDGPHGAAPARAPIEAELQELAL